MRAGINRTTLKRYADRNIITRIVRGQYALAGFVPDEFVLLQSGSENLIYSYGSAMYFWGLSDRTPHLLEFSVPQGYNPSRIKERDPNVRFHYVKSDIHSLGKTTAKSPQGGEVILYDRERCIRRSNMNICKISCARRCFSAATLRAQPFNCSGDFTSIPPYRYAVCHQCQTVFHISEVFGDWALTQSRFSAHA